MLLKVFNVIKGVNIDTSLIFSSVKTKKKKYTVLRSPFVHKKSKEQFFFETFMGFFTVNLKQKSIFILDYLEFAWVKLLIFPFFFKILVKKKIYLIKNET